MDHHCLFLYKCVGRDNQRLFLRFMTLTAFGMFAFQYSSLLMYAKLYGFSQFHHFETFFHEHCMVWSLMVLNIMSGLWLLQNISYQIDVISKGQTLYFQTHTKSKLHFKIRLQNVLNYYCGKPLYAIEDKDGVSII